MRQLQRQSSGFPYARQLHLSDIGSPQNGSTSSDGPILRIGPLSVSWRHAAFAFAADGRPRQAAISQARLRRTLALRRRAVAVSRHIFWRRHRR
jgi:hypothetical protein